MRPLVVDELDVSTPASRSALMLGVLTYFLLFATLTGGLHLAIDTTAGERERKSLEPLLTLPVTRASLLLGKMTATVCFMLASLALTLVAFTIALRQLPLEQIGMSSNFGLATAALAFVLVCPFAPLGAALMTAVAALSKTYREAQTYLTFVLLVPTLPLAFATLLNIEPEAKLMWIPSLSQHLLITTLIKDQPLTLSFVVISAASSLAFGAVLGWLADAPLSARSNSRLALAPSLCKRGARASASAFTSARVTNAASCRPFATSLETDATDVRNAASRERSPTVV